MRDGGGRGVAGGQRERPRAVQREHLRERELVALREHVRITAKEPNISPHYETGISRENSFCLFFFEKPLFSLSEAW